MGPDRRPGRGRPPQLWAAAWAGLALALRLWGAGRPSLWHDEALEWQRARLPWAPLLAGRPIDQDPPLMAAGLKLWLALGDQEAWLRAPAALCGAALVFLLGALTSRLWGPHLGRAAAALAALSPVLVHYGQELNQYSGMAALGLLLWWASDLQRRCGRPTDTRRLTGLSLLALAWHYGLAFPVTVQAIGWAWALARRPGSAAGSMVAWRPLLRHLGLLAALVLGLWWLGLGDRLAGPHAQARLFGTGPIKELDHLADQLWRELLVFQLTPFAGGPALAVAAGLGLLALLGGRRLWQGGGAGRRLIAQALGGLALLYLAEFLGLYPLGNRWALFLAPFLLVALAAGIAGLAGLRPGLDRAALALTLGAFALLLPQGDAATPSLALPREPLRQALAWIAERREAGDVVYLSHAAGPALDYYRHHLPPAGGLAENLVLGAAPSLQAPAEHLAGVLDTRQGACRVWLLLLRPQPGEAEGLRQSLRARGRQLRSAWVEGGLRVEGWSDEASCGGADQTGGQGRA